MQYPPMTSNYSCLSSENPHHFENLDWQNFEGGWLPRKTFQKLGSTLLTWRRWQGTAEAWVEVLEDRMRACSKRLLPVGSCLQDTAYLNDFWTEIFACTPICILCRNNQCLCVPRHMQLVSGKEALDTRSISRWGWCSFVYCVLLKVWELDW